MTATGPELGAAPWGPTGAPPAGRPPTGPPPAVPPTAWPPPAGPPPAGPRGRAPRGARRVGKLVAVLVVVQALAIASLNLWTPNTSRFMAAAGPDVVQQHVSIDNVSRNVLAAVMYHEDQDFPTRVQAFDWDEFGDRVDAHLRGHPDESGSTLHQQVAKNLFLSDEMSGTRKGVEALLAIEVAALVDDVQVLEIYVNVAQFGPELYGICAASWYYFDRPPHDVEQWQAIQLAGLLPSPGHVGRAAGGGIERVADGNPTSSYTIANAEAKLPRWFAQHGLDPVWELGVEGYAEPGSDDADSCSTMPAEVADRIAQEELASGAG
jgi:monofunctional biosynthetic peptidoglycan transglycosylase